MPREIEAVQLGIHGGTAQGDVVGVLEVFGEGVGVPGAVISGQKFLQILSSFGRESTLATGMDALSERVQTTLAVGGDGVADPGGRHDAHGGNLIRGETLVSVPEGKVPLSFAGQDVVGEAEGLELRRVFWGHLGVKASDASFYNR